MQPDLFLFLPDIALEVTLTLNLRVEQRLSLGYDLAQS